MYIYICTYIHYLCKNCCLFTYITYMYMLSLTYVRTIVYTHTHTPHLGPLSAPSELCICPCIPGGTPATGMPILAIIAMRACMSAKVAGLIPGGALPACICCCIVRSMAACAATSASLRRCITSASDEGSGGGPGGSGGLESCCWRGLFRFTTRDLIVPSVKRCFGTIKHESVG